MDAITLYAKTRRMKHHYAGLTAAQRDRLRGLREDARGISRMDRRSAGDLHVKVLRETRYAARERRFEPARQMLKAARTLRLLQR